MDYPGAREYIREAGKAGSIPGLERIRELLRRMGNPQDKIKTVHVAGTNGKGSVIAYLYSICREAGYRTGRYISPAVFSYREMIQAEGKNISEEEFAGIIFRISKIIADMEKEGLPLPTAFEIETAAAFEYFFQQGCDMALIETGLGGREDATNVIAAPAACVITHVGFDHTQFLGDTIEQIAREKAGIITPGTTVILSAQEDEVTETVKKAAEEKGGTLIVPELPVDVSYSRAGTDFSYQGRRFHTGMIGTFQVGNCTAAIETARTLGISENSIAAGVKKAVWNGRFEKIGDSPEFYLDGAHNPPAAQEFAATLQACFPGVKKIFIAGMFADKDYEKVMERTAGMADYIYTVSTEGIRGLDGKILARAAKKYNERVEFAADIKDAVKQAAERARQEKGAVIVYGTLSFLGKVKKIVEDLK